MLFEKTKDKILKTLAPLCKAEPSIKLASSFKACKIQNKKGQA
jgi:hypothetical protein